MNTTKNPTAPARVTDDVLLEEIPAVVLTHLPAQPEWTDHVILSDGTDVLWGRHVARGRVLVDQWVRLDYKTGKATVCHPVLSLYTDEVLTRDQVHELITELQAALIVLDQAQAATAALGEVTA
jgi:hypothetical protein